MKCRMQQLACENLMPGLQKKMNEGVASTECINPSDFRKMRGFLYCYLTRNRHRERMHLVHVSHGHAGTEKPKPLQSSAVTEGPGPKEWQHSEAEAKAQFKDTFPKAGNALGKLTDSGNRRVCKEQGCRAARAVNTTSDTRLLIHSERRAVRTESGTSAMPEEN